MDFQEQIDILIRARYPIIAVETHEEERLRLILKSLANSPRHRDKGLYFWSRTRGFMDSGGTELAGTVDPVAALETIDGKDTGIFVLCDFAPYLQPYGQEEPTVVRMLREVAWKIKSQLVTIIIVGPKWPDISTLEKEVKVIELPLPDMEEVGRMAETQAERIRSIPGATVDLKTGKDHIVSALLGMTASEIEAAIASAAIQNRGLSEESVPIILEEKRQIIRQTGSLTYSHPEPVDHLGGYKNIRRILEEAAATFSPAAREFGVEPSKGLLLVGLPGTGKDLTKKIASSVLGRPLLDLDFGSVMGEGGGVIGQAEMSVKKALSIATTIRGILGISEFEKAVGGLESSGRTDGGTTARTIGFLLNWMQEQEDVYVIATANDVRALKPEQIRQGRFSQIIFVDLPTAEDREDIFRVHLSKRKRSPEYYDLPLLAKASDGFSGAEIEAGVKAAILDAWMEGGVKVTDTHLLRRIKSVRPTSEVKKEEIDVLRKWAQDHLVVNSQAESNNPTNRRIEI